MARRGRARGAERRPECAIAAVRIGAPPLVDGRLDEPLWSSATAVTELVRREPVEWAAPGQETEIYLVFDGERIPIGARSLNPNPDGLHDAPAPTHLEIVGHERHAPDARRAANQEPAGWTSTSILVMLKLSYWWSP